jgi:poly-gamma-glutamate biosynthesis protein PgsC/CapC
LIELLPLSVGIGLVTGLLFAEIFGVAAGGMIVPGYLALSLSHPLDVLLTLGAALFTFGVVHTLSSLLILYGRRRTVLTLLVGYVVGAFLHSAAADYLAPAGTEFRLVGFVIPGLIALWIERQGIVETLAALLTASAVVRLVLIVVGVELAV